MNWHSLGVRLPARVARDVLLATGIVLTGCSSDKPAAASPAPAETVSRVQQVTRHRHYTLHDRNGMRLWFQSASTVIAMVADRAHGVSVGMAEHPDDESTRTYYAVPDKLQESDIASEAAPEPDGWSDVKLALYETISATNANIDLLQQAHDGSEEAARNAPDAADAVKLSFCNALAKARTHYVTAGGRANDLSIFYLSDDDEIPCVLVDEPAHPAMVLRKTVGIDWFEGFTGIGGQSADASSDAIIADHGIRMHVGDAVTVTEHRRSFDDGVPLLCRARPSSKPKNYWFACKDLREAQ